MPKFTKSMQIARKIIDKQGWPTYELMNNIITELWNNLTELEKEYERIKQEKFQVLHADLKKYDIKWDENAILNDKNRKRFKR